MSEENVWYCPQHGIIEFRDWPENLVLTDYWCPFPWDEHPKLPRPIGNVQPYLALMSRSELPAETPVRIWSYPLQKEITEARRDE